MRITDALLGEHGLFYDLFVDLEQRSDDVTSVDALLAAVAPIGAALLTHAEIEDELLFPALRPIFGDAGPIAVMRDEHAEIEELLACVANATQLDGARALLAQLLYVTRAHFAAEESVVFPAANSHLEPGTLHELGGAWSRRRGLTSPE